MGTSLKTYKSVKSISNKDVKNILLNLDRLGKVDRCSVSLTLDTISKLKRLFYTGLVENLNMTTVCKETKFETLCEVISEDSQFGSMFITKYKEGKEYNHIYNKDDILFEIHLNSINKSFDLIHVIDYTSKENTLRSLTSLLERLNARVNLGFQDYLSIEKVCESFVDLSFGTSRDFFYSFETPNNVKIRSNGRKSLENFRKTNAGWVPLDIRIQLGDKNDFKTNFRNETKKTINALDDFLNINNCKIYISNTNLELINVFDDSYEKKIESSLNFKISDPYLFITQLNQKIFFEDYKMIRFENLGESLMRMESFNIEILKDDNNKGYSLIIEVDKHLEEPQIERILNLFQYDFIFDRQI